MWCMRRHVCVRTHTHTCTGEGLRARGGGGRPQAHAATQVRVCTCTCTCCVLLRMRCVGIWGSGGQRGRAGRHRPTTTAPSPPPRQTTHAHTQGPEQRTAAGGRLHAAAGPRARGGLCAAASGCAPPGGGDTGGQQVSSVTVQCSGHSVVAKRCGRAALWGCSSTAQYSPSGPHATLRPAPPCVAPSGPGPAAPSTPPPCSSRQRQRRSPRPVMTTRTRWSSCSRRRSLSPSRARCCSGTCRWVGLLACLLMAFELKSAQLSLCPAIGGRSRASVVHACLAPTPPPPPRLQADDEWSTAFLQAAYARTSRANELAARVAASTMATAGAAAAAAAEPLTEDEQQVPHNTGRCCWVLWGVVGGAPGRGSSVHMGVWGVRTPSPACCCRQGSVVRIRRDVPALHSGAYYLEGSCRPS